MPMATCSSVTGTDAPALGLVRVRDALPADTEAIAGIYADEVLCGTSSYELEPPPASEMERRRATGVDGGYPWLVAANDEGRVLGYAYASPFRARPGYRWTVEDSVYIAAAARGRGIAGRLLAALVARCTELGFRQMIAVIGDADNASSIALHARAGFVEVARFAGIGRKHGRWLTNVQMLRPLGDGASSAPFADPGATA